MSDSRGPHLQGIVIFLLILYLVTVALRCYTRYFIINSFAVEDWLAVLALVLYIVFTAFVLLSVHHGLGRHLSDVPPAERPVAFMWRHFASITYIVISALSKFIVGLFLLRICFHIRWMKLTIWTMLVLVGLYYTFYFILTIFSAQPPQYYWLRFGPDPPEGRVNDEIWAIVPTIINSLLNVIVDWALAILPMILVWNARLDRRTKISVCGVLAVGTIASLAAIVRLPYTNRLLMNPDYLYNFTDFAIWSAVEIGLALSASSLGTLRPLLRKLKILSDAEIPVVTQLHHINNSGSYQRGGHVARLEAKAPTSLAGAHGDPSGSYISNVSPREIPDNQNHERGGAIGWHGLEEASESDMDLVIQRA